MRQKELFCADWNNQDLIAEWDWLFEDGRYTEQNNTVLGFVLQMPCKMQYEQNHITIWTDIPDESVSDEIFTRAMNLQEDNDDLVVRVTHKPGNRKTVLDTFFLLDD